LIATANGYLFAYKPGIVVAVDENNKFETAPNSFSLSQNYPNPFNPVTKIKFTAAVVDAKFASTTNVVLKIYNILGREIKTLVNEQKPPGSYEVEFDGNKLSSGVYFYKLSTGKFSKTKKMLLIK
jgi:flagellar hook assembly protein FlgD